MLRTNQVIDLVPVNGVYMQREYNVLSLPAPAPLTLLPLDRQVVAQMKAGPTMPIVLAPMYKDNADYIDFNRPQSRAIIERTKKLLAAPAKKTDDDTTRVRSWLIQAVKKEVRGSDTALSEAMRTAAHAKLRKASVDSMRIELNIKLDAIDRKRRRPVKLKMKPLTTLIAEALANKWIQREDGSFIRASNVAPGVNRLHVGKSVKSSSYMTQKEQQSYDNYVTRRSLECEVHCG